MEYDHVVVLSDDDSAYTEISTLHNGIKNATVPGGRHVNFQIRCNMERR
jgi:hypothetical protein